jgi:PAS domain S-box-containing protein
VNEQSQATYEAILTQAGTSAILETALDCIIVMDHCGNVVEFNPAAEATFGHRRADVIGRELADTIIPPAFRERHREGLRRYLSTGEGPLLGKRIEVVATRADGAEFPVELSILAHPGESPPLFTAYLRDISDRVRREQLRSVRLAATEVLADASTVKEAATGILRAVCEGLGWDVGFFWRVDGHADALVCTERFRTDDVPMTQFEAASCASRFRRGEGLPGHVWHAGTPAWLLEVTRDGNFPRAASAAKENLHSAFACPVTRGGSVLGVIEFFTQHIREPDADILETMTTVAGHVGQFVERKQAEEKLRRSEQDLADFFDNASMGLHWVGPDGTILRANRAELNLLGYTPDEYIGRNIADFHVDEPVISDILRRLSSKERLHDYPSRMRCKDGSIREVLIHSSVLFEDGRFVHTRCFTDDITDRKRAEEALRESEGKLRLLADTIPQLAWMSRPDGHIEWYNRRWYEYTGTTPEQMEGWGWQSVHDPDMLPKVMARWRTSLASGESFDMVFPLKGRDGQFRPFLTRVNPLRDAAGVILHWFGTNTDISEIKRMEEALRDTDRRKDEFLATLAHELRNPLAPIRNSLQILKLPQVDQATALHVRDVMERQVHHLVRLVDDLLDVSRVMRGNIELRKEPVELAAIVARAVETAQPLIDLQRHVLEISLPPERLRVHADPVRLTQILGNIVTNAAKYSEANARIELSVGRDGDEAVLRVRDNGIGIAPDMLPHVFDLFVQADHATARSQSGLGIGLSLVKSLVEMHGGTVEAESAGLGKGSQFTVRLPLLPEDGDAPMVQDNVIALPPASGLRLLVVDDNLDAANSLVLLLRLQGHDVRIAHDGASALKIATAYRPALVFLDLGMPEIDGYEVARRIRTTPGLERIVLVALTGWGQQEDRDRTAAAGFDHHLVKPPEPDAIEHVLTRLHSK